MSTPDLSELRALKDDLIPPLQSIGAKCEHSHARKKTLYRCANQMNADIHKTIIQITKWLRNHETTEQGTASDNRYRAICLSLPGLCKRVAEVSNVRRSQIEVGKGELAKEAKALIVELGKFQVASSVIGPHQTA